MCESSDQLKKKSKQNPTSDSDTNNGQKFCHFFSTLWQAIGSVAQSKPIIANPRKKDQCMAGVAI
jgi:hypothetical protein